jgi:hypothetical protein
LNVWFLIVVAFLLHLCEPRAIPPELFGTWKTDKHGITVWYGRLNWRTNRYPSASGSVFTTLTINSDKTVDGYIGSAVLENGKITIKGFPTYEIVVEGDLIGKIFENDPLDKKEVEIWFGWKLKKGNPEADLHKKGSNLCMAKLNFSKEED